MNQAFVIGSGFGAIILMAIALIFKDDTEMERALQLYSVGFLLLGILVCVYEVAFVGI